MPERMKNGRNPDAIVMMLTLFVVNGLLALAGLSPGSVLELVPPWVALLWAVALSLGAAVALAGILWRDPLTGWTLELCGRITVATTAGAYSVALANTIEVWGSAVVISFVAAVAVASVWRTIQLVRRFRDFRVAVLHQEEE